MIGPIAAAAALNQQTVDLTKPIDPTSRFELSAPLALPPVQIHHQLAKIGIAQSTARRLDLQARILWVDATANLGRVNSIQKIADLCQKTAETGFNTIVFDVKPINGYPLYPSKINEQLTSWRSDQLEPGFDPLHHMVEQAHKHKLTLLVSLNAFSEGHRFGKRDFGKADNQFFKPGWGYDHPELQSVRYIPLPIWQGFDISPTLDSNPTGSPIAIYTDPIKAPVDALYLTVDKSGLVITNGFEKPANLNGNALFAFTGDAIPAAHKFTPGSKIFITSRATYQTSGEAQNQIPLMMNPHLAQNQQRALDFITEVASNYKIDGLLYDDRLRYAGLDADFSIPTQRAFEKLLNQKVNWPDDIYTFRFTPSLTPTIRPGRLYDAWLNFRAETMTHFVRRAAQTLKQKLPQALFGIYAGSWYGDYQRYGTNYGSPDHQAGFPFLTHAYRKSGFAPHLDLLITGCYYPTGTVFEALQNNTPIGRTVEAAGILTNRLTRDQSWAVAGVSNLEFQTNPAGIEPILQAATATTQGIMVFDHIYMDQLWPTFARAFKTPTRAPYQVPGLLQKVRAQRADFTRRGIAEPPVPLFEGAPGTGF